MSTDAITVNLPLDVNVEDLEDLIVEGGLNANEFGLYRMPAPVAPAVMLSEWGIIAGAEPAGVTVLGASDYLVLVGTPTTLGAYSFVFRFRYRNASFGVEYNHDVTVSGEVEEGAPPPLLPTITINDIGGRIRIGSLDIQDHLNDAPNTCSLIIEGTEPLCGEAVRIEWDGVRLFNGTIESVDLTYEGEAILPVWYCTATDDLARLNRKRPFGAWVDVSATVVAQELLAFAAGFTGLHIEAGLPNVTLVCTGSTTMSAAYAALAAQIGGGFKVEDLDVFLFLDGGDSPEIEEVTDTWTGDGIETVFTLTTSPVLSTRGYVTVNAVNETLGLTWILDTGAGTITRDAPPPDLATIEMIYGSSTLSGAPDPIDLDHPFCESPRIRRREDLSQLRTRVYVKGSGTSATGVYEAPVNAYQGGLGSGNIAPGPGGAIPGSSAHYRFSYVTADGETPPGTPLSVSGLTGANHSVVFTDLDDGLHPDPRVTGRKLWRDLYGGGADWRLVTTFGNVAVSPADTYTDSVADEDLGTDPPVTVNATASIFVQVDDEDAQAARAAIEGGDGIHEDYITDASLTTQAMATIRGEVALRLFASPLVTVTYATRDLKTASGKTVVIDLDDPAPGIHESLLIQSVSISEIGTAGDTPPKFTVTASSVRFTLEGLLRQALAGRA